MRLTLIISTLDCGGAERVMTTMANYWVGAGDHITLLTLADESQPPFYELDGRVQHLALGGAGLWSRLAAPLPNALTRLGVLRRAIRKSRPDVVISFLDTTNVTTLLATRGLGLPVIVSERGDPWTTPATRSWRCLRRWTYPQADGIVVLNDTVRGYFPQRMHARIAVIPNPVLPPPADANDAVIDVANPLVVAMGRMDHHKGFDLLLRSFARLSDRWSDWNLVILGDGPLRHDLQSLANELGLSRRLLMPGRVKNPHEILQRADLFVMSSRSEGFGNATCEAMACGLPVISADCPSGPRSIIRHGHDGVLVPSEDVAALAAAMDRLMGSKEERERLAVHAREVTRRFGLEHIMSMWERLVSDVTLQKAEYS